MSTVIKVENVSKLYRLGEVGTGSLAHDVNRWWHKIRGKEDPYLKIGQVNDRTKSISNSPTETLSTSTSAQEMDYMWALKDISFEVKQGEVLGIIGRNGAGKSTLLKILSRVTKQTTGRIKVKGRIASLLEVGTGFHPELTGRDNIFLNGAILGMRKTEIAAKFDEIVEFSGCARYIDTPVKRYSSGMYVRLAFAVAAHLESEILILDEILAVGDAEFQKKCLGKMKSVAGEGRTVLFVSHNMAAVRQLCERLLLVVNGQVKSTGDVDSTLLAYLSQEVATNQQWIRPLGSSPSAGEFSSISVELLGIQPEHELLLTCILKLETTNSVMIAFDVSDSNGTVLMQALPYSEPFIAGLGNHRVEVRIALPPLIPRAYEISAWMGTHNTETTDYIERCVRFEVIQSPNAKRSFPHTADHGWIAPRTLSCKITKP